MSSSNDTLNDIKTKVEVLISEFTNEKEQRAKMEKTLFNLLEKQNHTIYGNGKKGLVTSDAEHEQAIDTLVKDLEEIKAGQRKSFWWFVGVITTLLVEIATRFIA